MMTAVEETRPVGVDRLEIGVQALNLFLVGFLVLFLELACIRWFAANVVFLQFFTNVVLIASFLGMSCGCLAARRTRDWLGCFPIIALSTVVLALALSGGYRLWAGLSIDVGGQTSPQEVFFGTEGRNPDVAKFVIPIEAVAAVFFVVIALMFVGLGQVLGRAFDSYPNRVAGYTLNIGGSLAGIVGFSGISFIQAPPIAWFFIVCAGIAYLLHQSGALSRFRALALVALVLGLGVPLDWFFPDYNTRWSPYYMILHNTANHSIAVNATLHQGMIPFESNHAEYSLIHLLQRDSGGAPFRDVLIIGAGSGNDLAHALRFGASQIDAVEIDPVIQDIGRHFHPDHPYQDTRVIPHLDDGRHFLRTTDRKYDLVVYALVDSLILHSGYANIRLESYLFTEQAFADVRRVLKPGGIFVMYNLLRQGWVVERIAAIVRLVWHYVGLLIFLTAGVLVPVDVFLNGGILWRYAAPCILALGPMFFAGVIFAASFRDAMNPDLAFGSNIAGSVLGGLAESFSMLLGFQHLLLVAMLFYLLSAWSPQLRRASA